jgi:hypothetical protein
MGIRLNPAVLLREITFRHGLAGRLATLGKQSLSCDPARAALPEARLYWTCAVSAVCDAGDDFETLGRSSLRLFEDIGSRPP